MKGKMLLTGWRGAGLQPVAGHVTTAVRLAPRRPRARGGGGGQWLPSVEVGSHVGAQAVLPFEQCLEWYLENNMALGEDDRALAETLVRRCSSRRSMERNQGHAEQRVGPIGVGCANPFHHFHPRNEGSSREREQAKRQVSRHDGRNKKIGVRNYQPSSQRSKRLARQNVFYSRGFGLRARSYRQMFG